MSLFYKLSFLVLVHYIFKIESFMSKYSIHSVSKFCVIGLKHINFLCVMLVDDQVPFATPSSSH